MIDRLQLLRNIGQFDSVDRAANIPLARLTLVYSENGRGKTTLAAVLRSLATGDPLSVDEFCALPGRPDIDEVIRAAELAFDSTA